MLTEKIDDLTYQIELYDWDTHRGDYIAGYLKRDDSDEAIDTDRCYWRFYPSNWLAPISAGDLDKLSKFIANLNKS